MRAHVVGLRCLVAALSTFAAACTQLATEADVGIGTAGYVLRPAASYAALYKPYAQMSALAYIDRQFMTADERACPDAKKLRDPKLADADHRAQDNLALADWLDDLQRSGWTCVRSHTGAIGCPPNRPCAGGLQVMGWKRRNCEEVVIAFRGTDKNEAGDWESNLRFLYRSVFDQYDQVAKVIATAVDRIEQGECWPHRIVTTGHSLGGGLAQQAAFAEPRIDYVYAFDPSPIVGFFNVSDIKRVRNVEDLGIDRVYESGEVLALSRSLSSGIYATSQCRPRIRTVRFATLQGGSGTQRHSIGRLTSGLIELAKQAEPNAPLPYGFNRAEDCTLAAPDMGG